MAAVHHFEHDHVSPRLMSQDSEELITEPQPSEYLMEESLALNISSKSKQDDYNGAIQLFIFLIGLSFTLIIAHMLPHEKEANYITRNTLEIVLTLYMLGATGIILILWRSKCALALHFQLRTDVPPDGLLSVSQALQEKLRQVLPLIGIVLFYILGVFLDTLRISAHTYCFIAFYDCGVWVTFLISTLFHMTRLIFMGILMLFSIAFHNRVLLNCVSVNCGLFCIMAATLSIWFDSITNESIAIFESDDILNVSCANSTGDAELCLHLPERNSSLYLEIPIYSSLSSLSTRLPKFHEFIAPYLYPLNVEFLLLVMELLLHLTWTMVPEDTMHALQTGKISQIEHNHDHSSEEDSDMDSGDDEECHGQQLVEPPTENEISYVSSESVHNTQGRHSRNLVSSYTIHILKYLKCWLCFEGHDDQEHLDNHLMECDSNIIDQHQEGHQKTPLCLCSRQVAFFLALMPNIAFVTLGIMTYYDSEYNPWLECFKVYRTLYHMTGTIVCIIGFHVARKFHTRKQELHSLEMMVIISAFGLALLIFFSLIAAFGMILNPDDEKRDLGKPLSWLLVLAPLSHIFDVGLQTIFLSLSFRVQFQTENDNPRTSSQDRECDEACGDPILIDLDRSDVNSMQTILLKTGSPQMSEELIMSNGSNQRGNVSAYLNPQVPEKEIFLNVLLYLVIFNLTLWVVDSFIQSKNEEIEQVQSQYYGHHSWHLIYHVIMPLVLFFRFNSGILFAEIFLNH